MSGRSRWCGRLSRNELRDAEAECYCCLYQLVLPVVDSPARGRRDDRQPHHNLPLTPCDSFTTLYPPLPSTSSSSAVSEFDVHLRPSSLNDASEAELRRLYRYVRPIVLEVVRQAFVERRQPSPTAISSLCIVLEHLSATLTPSPRPRPPHHHQIRDYLKIEFDASTDESHATHTPETSTELNPLHSEFTPKSNVEEEDLDYLLGKMILLRETRSSLRETKSLLFSKRAASVLKSCLTLQPTREDVWSDVGDYYSEKYRHAEETFDEWKKELPPHVAARKALRYVLLSVRCYRRAVELTNSFKELQQLLSQHFTDTTVNLTDFLTLTPQLHECVMETLEKCTTCRLDRVLWRWGMQCYTVWRLFTSPTHFTTTLCLGSFALEPQRWSSLLQHEIRRTPSDAQFCFLVMSLLRTDHWYAPYMLTQTLRHRSLLTPEVHTNSLLSLFSSPSFLSHFHFRRFTSKAQLRWYAHVQSINERSSKRTKKPGLGENKAFVEPFFRLHRVRLALLLEHSHEVECLLMRCESLSFCCVLSD